MSRRVLSGAAAFLAGVLVGLLLLAAVNGAIGVLIPKVQVTAVNAGAPRP